MFPILAGRWLWDILLVNQQVDVVGHDAKGVRVIVDRFQFADAVHDYAGAFWLCQLDRAVNSLTEQGIQTGEMRFLRPIARLGEVFAAERAFQSA